jgi:hypothetical protein
MTLKNHLPPEFRFRGLQTLSSFFTLAPHFLQANRAFSASLKSFLLQAVFDMAVIDLKFTVQRSKVVPQ